MPEPFTEHSGLYVRSRRFLAFFFRIVRHTTIIILTLIGSAFFLVPAWLRPLLNPAAQRMLDQCNVFPTRAYPHIAYAILIVGFVWACFLAWEEENLESEKTRAENKALQARLNEPDYEARLLQYSGIKKDAPLDVIVRLEINNKGGQGRVDGWWLGIDPPLKEPGWVLLPMQQLTVDNPAHSRLQLLHAEFEQLPSTSLLVPAREIVRLKARFTLADVTWAQAMKDGTRWTIGFHDNFGNGYELQSTWKDDRTEKSEFYKSDSPVPKVKAGHAVRFTLETQQPVQIQKEDPKNSE